MSHFLSQMTTTLLTWDGGGHAERDLGGQCIGDRGSGGSRALPQDEGAAGEVGLLSSLCQDACKPLTFRARLGITPVCLKACWAPPASLCPDRFVCPGLVLHMLVPLRAICCGIFASTTPGSAKQSLSFFRPFTWCSVLLHHRNWWVQLGELDGMMDPMCPYI